MCSRNKVSLIQYNNRICEDLSFMWLNNFCPQCFQMILSPIASWQTSVLGGWSMKQPSFLFQCGFFTQTAHYTLQNAHNWQHIYNTHFSNNAVSQNPHSVYSQITHCQMHTTHYNTHCTLIYFLFQCGFKLFTAQCHTTFKKAHLHLIHILILIRVSPKDPTHCP